MTMTTTLIATARNEGPFLLEWVAYHRAIGFDRIIVLSDISEDGSEVLLDALDAVGAITHIPKSALTSPPGNGHRNRAYAYALALPEVQASDWVMVLDIDEFLNVHAGDGTVGDLLSEVGDLGDTDVISPNWRIFGNAGHALYADQPIMTTLTRANPETPVLHDKHLGIKSMFRPGPVTRIGPHRPQLNGQHTGGQLPTVWRNGSGDDVTDRLLIKGWSVNAKTRGSALAQINHYMVRSNAVFALHNLIDPPLGGEQSPLSVADHSVFNTNQVEDTSITRWSKATAREIKRLRGDAAVDQAHTDSVAAFQKLIGQMQINAAKDATDPINALLSPEKTRAIMQAQLPKPETDDDDDSVMQLVDPDDIAPRWLADLRRSDHRRGWYYSDEKFALQMTYRSTDTLIVSFDNLSSVKEPSLARETWGYPFYRSEGWSHLGVMAFEKNWFRDEALFNFIEGQAKSGLFKRFRRVVMTGTSMGAYAATAFSSLAPGCTVMAFSPQSTLDKKLVPWEERFGSGRKQDWSGRYRDAPDCCGQAKDVFIIYDPYFEPDRLHAERYQGCNIHHLKSWYSSHKSALFMRRADMLKGVMQAAVAGEMTPHLYYQMFRSRRDLPWYYHGLADHAIKAGHKGLAGTMAGYLAKNGRPAIAKSIEARIK
ncbi:glycosyltransferase family 2 protein [Loktanella sp. F6476L]|uniref:glycosyltransferase family 2 protein n=1 Tax=Loktanella sp. F6476L TaxID=2926405 RepID=UPI001FF3C1F8|nr:glycosyltransferase family 2 protein [Loktanella sp. F6476L]MCK0122145.1 glycosyltransferase family 2 protein [Loktanella sp. F6476L]